MLRVVNDHNWTPIQAKNPNGFESICGVPLQDACSHRLEPEGLYHRLMPV
jgi:hypothetical protein